MHDERTSFGKGRLASILKNTGWMVADRFFRLGLAFFTAALVARYLGPHDYGLLNYSTSFVALFAGIAMMGLDRIIIRDLSAPGCDESKILGTAVFLRVVALGVSGSLSVLLALVVGVDDPKAFLMVLILAGSNLVQFGDVLDLSFQARLDVRRSMPARLVGTTFSTALKVYLVYSQCDVVAFAAIGLVEGISITAIIVYAYRRSRGCFPGFVPDLKYVWRLVEEGWPLFLALNVDILYQRYFAVVVGKILGPEQVGYYGLASRLIDIPLMLLVLATASFIPDLSRLVDTKREAFIRSLSVLTEWWILGGLACVLVTVATSSLGVEIIFSRQYLPAVPVVNWMILTVFFQAMGAYRAIYCTIVRKQKSLLYINIASLGASVLFSYMFIPRFGAVGAAIALSASALFGYVFMSWAMPSTREFFHLEMRSLFLPNLRGSAIEWWRHRKNKA